MLYYVLVDVVTHFKNRLILSGTLINNQSESTSHGDHGIR